MKILGSRRAARGRSTSNGDRRAALRRPRILLTTEGTYPYAMGGVSSWCELLVGALPEFDWLVVPITPAERRPAVYQLPSHARLMSVVELWSEELPRRRRARRPADTRRPELPGELVRGLVGWRGDLERVTESLVWSRQHAAEVRSTFRSRAGWNAFLSGLKDVLDEEVPEAGRPPALDLIEAATLYQMLYWVARTASAPTPECDVLHVTAAGWAALPAVVHKALHGTPLVLTEHGVYVREAYLAAARSGNSPGTRFISTRLARGLARLAYNAADVVAPVTDANARWEEGLGVDPDDIQVIYNGVQPPPQPVRPPGSRTVVSVGRIDPLKDIHTLLRVAQETLRHVPDATFLHYGPVTPGQETYGRSCRQLHKQLGLEDRFRFMGPTRDPHGVVRAADVVVMTSISEGLPMSILEAMGQGRPIVATAVGGVADVVKGCGVVTRPGDVHGLAMALTTLLRRSDLAHALGVHGYRRLERTFDQKACIDGYRDLLWALTRAARVRGAVLPLAATDQPTPGAVRMPVPALAAGSAVSG